MDLTRDLASTSRYSQRFDLGICRQAAQARFVSGAKRDAVARWPREEPRGRRHRLIYRPRSRNNGLRSRSGFLGETVRDDSSACSAVCSHYGFVCDSSGSSFSLAHDRFQASSALMLTQAGRDSHCLAFPSAPAVVLWTKHALGW